MVELFKLAIEEAREMKDETLEKLIKFNRDLKVSYAGVKQRHSEFTVSLENKMQENVKELRKIEIDPK